MILSSKPPTKCAVIPPSSRSEVTRCTLLMRPWSLQGLGNLFCCEKFLFSLTQLKWVRILNHTRYKYWWLWSNMVSFLVNILVPRNPCVIQGQFLKKIDISENPPRNFEDKWPYKTIFCPWWITFFKSQPTFTSPSLSTTYTSLFFSLQVHRRRLLLLRFQQHRRSEKHIGDELPGAVPPEVVGQRVPRKPHASGRGEGQVHLSCVRESNFDPVEVVVQQRWRCRGDWEWSVKYVRSLVH